MRMKEGLGKWARGILAAGGLAAGAPEMIADAHASPTGDSTQEQESRESDTAWALEAQQLFDDARTKGDVEAQADAIRAFLYEYHHPTRGKIRTSAQGNPMRVLDRSEWQQVRLVGSHFMQHANSWEKDYPGLRTRITDVLAWIDERIDEPGGRNAHKTYYGPSGDIDRSLGYK